MELKDRIKQGRLIKKLSQEALGDAVGVSKQAISQFETGQNDPSAETYEKINKALDFYLSSSELLDEDNEELHSQTADYNVNKTPSINIEHKGVPYFDIDFIGGFDLVLNNQQIQPNFYIDFMPFNDADYYVNVTGKSMGPLIAHGDIVALKKVEDWKSFLLEGEIYAVVTNNGFRTIKIIGAGETPNDYMLIPYNKNDVYKPQPIPKNVITHIFRVKGAMKRFF